MARRGDGIYLRSRTWWLDFTHEGKRHITRLGKNISRTTAVRLARVKRAAVLKGEAGLSAGREVDQVTRMALNGIALAEPRGRGRGGWVYLLDAGGVRYKIGHTVNLKHRLAEIGTSSPVPIRLHSYVMAKDAAQAERDLHRQFARYRVRGEWFEIPPRLVPRLQRLMMFAALEGPRQTGYRVSGVLELREDDREAVAELLADMLVAAVEQPILAPGEDPGGGH